MESQQPHHGPNGFVLSPSNLEISVHINQSWTNSISFYFKNANDSNPIPIHTPARSFRNHPDRNGAGLPRCAGSTCSSLTGSSFYRTCLGHLASTMDHSSRPIYISVRPWITYAPTPDQVPRQNRCLHCSQDFLSLAAPDSSLTNRRFFGSLL